MGFIRSFPGLIKVFNTLRVFNHYEEDIKAAREAGDYELERKVIADSSFQWATRVTEVLPIEVEVRGAENIPDHDGCVYVANHQGYADIIAMIIGAKGHQMGFVAKDSLEKVPYLGRWIKNLHGIFITRGNSREALKSFQAGVKSIKDGFNVIIFPEGTRSRGPEMGEFKAGSFKLATRAKAPIIPVTLNGSYHLFEETGAIRPAHITVVFHPMIETAGLSRTELRALEKRIEEQIRSTLKQLNSGSEPDTVSGKPPVP